MVDYFTAADQSSKCVPQLQLLRTPAACLVGRTATPLTDSSSTDLAPVLSGFFLGLSLGVDWFESVPLISGAPRYLFWMVCPLP